MTPGEWEGRSLSVSLSDRFAQFDLATAHTGKIMLYVFIHFIGVAMVIAFYLLTPHYSNGS